MKFFALIIGLSISLSACTMPTGYVYHDGLYKTPTPRGVPGANLISNTQSAQISNAMQDLVGRLTARAGLAPKSVYVHTPKPATALQTLMDNDLRDALRRAGYRLASSPEEAGYVMTHDLSQIRDEIARTSAEISIHVYNGLPGKDVSKLTSENGFYRIESLEHILH